MKKAATKKAPAKTAATKQAATNKAVTKKAPATTEATPGSAPQPQVRAEDVPWTAAELADVRAELEADQVRLTAEIDAAQSQRNWELDGGADSSGDDQADAGAATFEREQEMSLQNNARDLLLQTERALAALDEGSYGRCEQCGEPIAKVRLQAFPRATLCVRCKQREERR